MISDAEARGEQPPIPASSIEKPPSAELRPGQVDSDSLPDYELLDAVVDGYVVGDLGHADRTPDTMVTPSGVGVASHARPSCGSGSRRTYRASTSAATALARRGGSTCAGSRSTPRPSTARPSSRPRCTTR